MINYDKKIKKVVILCFMVVMLLLLIDKPYALKAPKKTNITYCKSLKEGQLTLKWKNTKAKKYEILVAKNKKFTQGKKKYKSTKTKLTINGLSKGTKYYVKVRTYKNKAYSKWTNVKTVTIHKHSYEKVKESKPNKNQTKYKCKCGSIKTVPVHKHSYKKIVMSKPNCDYPGQTYYDCKCGYGYEVSVPKLEHEYRWVNGGSCQQYKCKYCNHVTIEKFHSYSVYESKAPTCIQKGYNKVICDVCGHKDIEYKNYSTHDYKKVGETDKQYLYQCLVCKNNYNCDKLITADTVDREYVIDLGDGKTHTIIGHFDAKAADEIFNLLNEYRAEKGIAKLKKGDVAHQQGANIRGYEAAYKFSHTRPNGKSCYTAVSTESNSYYVAGENLVQGQSSAAHAVELWKNSPGHNANMLRESFDSVCISVFMAKKADGGYYATAVQLFGRDF